MFEELQTKETDIPSFWKFGKNVMGLEENVASYIQRLPITLPPFPEVFEAGCGSGTVSFAVLARWPNAHYVATDTDGRMLLNMARRALRKKIPPQQLEIGEAEPNNPAEVTFLDRDAAVRLKPESFDIVIASAVLERGDMEASVPVLLRLLKPGGYFLDIGVRDTLAGTWAASLQHFSVIPEETLLQALSLNGCRDVSAFPLVLSEFPGNLFLTGWIARKQ